MGVGIATIQTLIPEVIKQSFPERAAIVTGAYTVSTAVGAMIAASAVIPISGALGDWPVALALWGTLAIPAVVAWLPLVREWKGQNAAASSRKLPLGNQRVWLVVAVFSITTLTYFSTISWLPPLYQDAGLGEAKAGVMLSVWFGVQIVSVFVVPAIVGRYPDRRPWLAGLIGGVVVGLVLISLTPNAQPWMPWAWTTLFGFSQGALFSLSLTLPLDNSATPEIAGKLAGVSFLVGYTLAAIGPAAIGAARDITGSFTAPFLALAALGCMQFILTLRITPGVTVDEAENLSLTRKREKGMHGGRLSEREDSGL